ncbi:MAG: periplasmic heavy metal sensor [Candidatus Omnitrophica bacterium]|nr:periplasmic heavy metal sensor [Candidatus Omnitrophota bacterium]
MKKLIFFTVLVSVVTLASFWGGKKACMLMWPGSVNPSQSWYSAVGLNAEQAESLKKLDASFRKDADKLCMTICGERMSLLNLMKDKNADPEAVYGKIEKIGNLQIILEKQIAGHILEVKKNLTPEQSRAYLDRIHKELRQAILKNGYGEVLNQ